MTLTEKVVCTIYTGFVFYDGDELIPAVLLYANHLLGRSVTADEIFNDEDLRTHLHYLSTEDFMAVCKGEPIAYNPETRESGFG